MSREVAKRPVDPTQFPEAAHKLARRALREHQRAQRDAASAVQHALRSGQALNEANDLCEHGRWRGFFELHFEEDEFSLRTAQTYMQLARDWPQLAAQHPAGLSSIRQAMKALAAIAPPQEKARPKTRSRKSVARDAFAEGPPQATGVSHGPDGDATASDPDRAETGDTPGTRGCSQQACSPAEKSVARDAFAGGKPARTGPVWRALGPFVREALGLVNSVDALMRDLVGHGYGLAEEAATVHSAASRLQLMLDQELDEAEAQQAAGEWMWVIEQPANDSQSEAGHDE